MALVGILGHSLATGYSRVKWHSGAGALTGHRVLKGQMALGCGCRGTHSKALCRRDTRLQGHQIDVDIKAVMVVPYNTLLLYF